MELSVCWAPVYELLISFVSFADPKHHRLIELGPEWVRRVRADLPPAYRERLARVDAGFLKRTDELLYMLLRVAPPGLNAEGALEWLGALSVGELYERLAPMVPTDGPSLPRDLGVVRDRWIELLGGWNEGYFRGVEPAILGGLAAAAEALRGRVGTRAPVDLVEEATNGVRIDPERVPAALLIPQHHGHPLNHVAHEERRMIFLYACDVLPARDDAPPSTLLRTARALADESRLRILRFLAGGPRSLTEVARFASLSQSTVHHHLIALRGAGLVRVHVDRTSPTASSRYSLRPGADERLGGPLRSYLEGKER